MAFFLPPLLFSSILHSILPFLSASPTFPRHPSSFFDFSWLIAFSRTPIDITLIIVLGGETFWMDHSTLLYNTNTVWWMWVWLKSPLRTKSLIFLREATNVCIIMKDYSFFTLLPLSQLASVYSDLSVSWNVRPPPAQYFSVFTPLGYIWAWLLELHSPCSPRAPQQKHVSL